MNDKTSDTDGSADNVLSALIVTAFAVFGGALVVTEILQPALT